jgi:UDPglucose--hexose-1-phosphate uridylyltransferase
MPELRRDPILGRWVIIATERAKRPHDFAKPEQQPPDNPEECPFCEGHEHMTPPEIYAIRENGSEKDKPGWSVRVVPSITPLLRVEGDIGRKGWGIYDIMNAIGAHEVIIETPQHITHLAHLPEEQIAKVIGVYVYRSKDLEGDPRIKYVMIYKNYGQEAGGGHIRHAKAFLIATPVTPKRVKEELEGAKLYFEYKDRCIFCDIIRQERESGERLILENDSFIAIAPFASRFPFEPWILPKRHCCDFYKITEGEIMDLAKMLKEVLTRLEVLLNDPPFNFIIHTSPFRKKTKPGYWKTIEEDYHWHIEIMPRITRVAGFEWGSGFYINPTPPEEAAKYMREGDERGVV